MAFLHRVRFLLCCDYTTMTVQAKISYLKSVAHRGRRLNGNTVLLKKGRVAEFGGNGRNSDVKGTGTLLTRTLKKVQQKQNASPPSALGTGAPITRTCLVNRSVGRAYRSKINKSRYAFQLLSPEYKDVCCDGGTQITPYREGLMLLKSSCFDKGSVMEKDLLEILRTLSVSFNCHKFSSEPEFSKLLQAVARGAQHFSNDFLLEALKAFVALDLPSHLPEFEPFEDELYERMGDSDIDRLLLVGDLCIRLGLCAPRFHEKFFASVVPACSKLTRPQTVQLAYIAGEYRRVPSILMKYLEYSVLRHLCKMNMEELGVVCLGYFKVKSLLTQETMLKIGDILIGADLDSTSNFTLVNILKMFRLTHTTHPKFIKAIGQTLQLRLPTIGISSIMHFSLALSSLHWFDEALLQKISSEILGRNHLGRCKDISKILWSFALINYEPPMANDFFNLLTDQIRRKLKEFLSYPQHFITALIALAITGRYPYDLLNEAFRQTFVRSALQNTPIDLTKDLFALDQSVALECSDYSGNHLPEYLRQKLRAAIQMQAVIDWCAKPFIIQAVSTLEALLGGPQFVKAHAILPHTRSLDLEIHLNQFGSALAVSEGKTPAEEAPSKTQRHSTEVEVTDELLSQLVIARSGKMLPLHQKDGTAGPNGNKVSISWRVRKLAIQVTNGHHYRYHSRVLLGQSLMKYRQLGVAGYEVMEIPYWEWLPILDSSPSKQLEYMQQRLYGWRIKQTI
uniref:FAST kinase domain-containing protein 5, mitochondrial-like n=1 Tax=Myxine glutinosa TaxID=7769 RepID=UPI00358E060A